MKKLKYNIYPFFFLSLSNFVVAHNNTLHFYRKSTRLMTLTKWYNDSLSFFSFLTTYKMSIQILLHGTIWPPVQKSWKIQLFFGLYKIQKDRNYSHYSSKQHKRIVYTRHRNRKIKGKAAFYHFKRWRESASKKHRKPPENR